MRPTGDHFYTASVAERDTAIAALGYVDEGVACWTPVVQGPGVRPGALDGHSVRSLAELVTAVNR